MELWTNAHFEKLLESLSIEDRKLRHNIRYACFRIQTEKAGGNLAEEKHHEIAKKIEEVNGFGGWANFAMTWDVSTPNPITIVKRKWSIYQEWNQTLMRVAVELPMENNSFPPKSIIKSSPKEEAPKIKSDNKKKRGRRKAGTNKEG